MTDYPTCDSSAASGSDARTGAGSTGTAAPTRHQRRHRHHWRRDLVELAALFTAVTVADTLAKTVLGGPDGPVLLLASAVVLLLTAAFHTWWSRRYEHAPPPPDTGRGPDSGAAAGRSADSPARSSGPAGAEDADPGVRGESVLWRMRTTVLDRPGALAALCTTLAGREVDILALQTHPLGASTVDEFLLRVPAAVGPRELTAAVATAGGSETWLERADAHDLVDTPARVLRMAARTALDSSELPLALRELLGRCSIRSLPAARGGRPLDEADPVPAEGVLAETVIRLPDPTGGELGIERPHLPFTPTEFARARALVELDSRLGRRLPQRREVLELAPDLPGAGEVTVRRADLADLEAAKAMHERCSAATLSLRYHGPAGDADRYLRHLLSPRFGRTLAVESEDGRIVALGHLLWDGEESEVALIVEDAWQRRGLGAELLRRLVALAVEARCDDVYAVTRASNTGMVAAMRGLGLPLDYQFEEGTLVISARLAPLAAAAEPRR